VKLDTHLCYAAGLGVVTMIGLLSVPRIRSSWNAWRIRMSLKRWHARNLFHTHSERDRAVTTTVLVSNGRVVSIGKK
jgi:hypothetical protein